MGVFNNCENAPGSETMIIFKRLTICGVLVLVALLSLGVVFFVWPDISRKLQQNCRKCDEWHQNPSSHLLSPVIDKDGLGSPEFWIAHGGGVGGLSIRIARKPCRIPLIRDLPS